MFKNIKRIIFIFTIVIVFIGVVIFYNNNILLKLIIFKEYPRIVDIRMTDFEKISILRQWAYEHIDMSTRSNLLDCDESFGFYKRDIYDIFKAFFEDRGGVYCGGAAYSLMKLYNLYGYKSYTVDMGKVGVMTHVVTLVKIKQNGEDILSIQDPTFGLTYVDENNVSYDYFYLLKILKERKHKDVIISYGDSHYRDYIINPDDSEKDDIPYIDSLDDLILVLPDGKLKYKANVTLDRFNKAYGSNINNFLEQERYPPDTIYLFMYPLSIGGEKDAKQLFDMAVNITSKEN